MAPPFLALLGAGISAPFVADAAVGGIEAFGYDPTGRLRRGGRAAAMGSEFMGLQAGRDIQAPLADEQLFTSLGNTLRTQSLYEGGAGDPLLDTMSAQALTQDLSTQGMMEMEAASAMAGNVRPTAMDILARLGLA